MGEVERRGIVGAVARDGDDLAALLQEPHEPLLVQGPGPRKNLQILHTGQQLPVAGRGELCPGHAVAVAVGRIVPKADLAGDFASGGRSVAGDDLNGDSGTQAPLYSSRNVIPHRVGDGRDTRKGQSAPSDSLLTGIGIGFGPSNGERPHGAALEIGQLLSNLGTQAVIAAQGPHDFGCPFDAQQFAPGDPAADDGSHILALGGESEPVDNLRSGPQRLVIEPSTTQPREQRPLGGIAENPPLGIEERGGIGRDDLGEFGVGQGIVTHQPANMHAVLREGPGLVGTDDRHGAHGLARVHLTDQIIGFQHAAHGHGQRKRNAHGQPLGHGHDDDGDRNHEEVEHLLRNGEPVLLQ